MAAPTVLRAATHRLTTTPANELPSIATYLATCLGDCRNILSEPQTQKRSAGQPDTGLLVQKLKSRITSLLQDKTVEGRWTAVILVKATIEAGQWEILRTCEPWVRGMLAILGRPDPTSTKKLCIVTLTRIFQLTRGYQSLVREVTTPSLPSFITTCLNLVSVKETRGQNRKLKGNFSLLEQVLSSMLELLPHHPTVFRPFSAQIHSLVLPLVGASPSVHHVPGSPMCLARRLFVSLHHCAPKNITGEEWLKACKSTIASIHQTCDNLFRGVVEQWESVDTSTQQIAKPKNYSRAVGDEGNDALGLPGWQGIHAGSERTISLLKLLSEFISMRTNSSVSVPIGTILDMTSRLTSMTVPSSHNDQSSDGIALNPEVGQDERNELWSELPNIHRAAVNLLSSIVKVFGSGTVSIAQNCLDQTLWVFEAESFNTGVRTASYETVGSILPVFGPSMTKSGVSSLASLIRYACRDHLPDDISDGGQQSAKSTSKTNQPSHNADTFLSSQVKGSVKDSTILKPPRTIAAASKLLSNVFNFLPSEYISPPVRAEMDRTAILTGGESIMISSVLNPVPVIKGTRSIPSILPFLARRHAESVGTEGLLRPRMPVLINQSKFTAMDFEDEEEHVVRPAPTFSEVNGHTADNKLAQGFFTSTESLMAAGSKRARQGAVGTFESKPTLPAEESSSPIKRARVETSRFTSSFTGPAPVQREPAPQPTVPLQTTFPSEQSTAVEEITAAKSTLPQPIASAAPVSTSTIARTEESNPQPGTVQLESKTVVDTDVSHTNENDESDDEIPSLNIEPDTDEDEE